MKNPLEKWILSKTRGVSIEEFQIAKIKETLNHACGNSKFYRKLYEEADVSELKTFVDFQQLPFVTAKDLTDYGVHMICVPQSEIERIVTLETSGTSGNPKRVYFTGEDLELTTDFFHNGMRCLIDESDNFMILLPYKTPGSVGDLLRLGLNRLGCSAFAYGLIEDYRQAGEFLLKNKMTSLVGSPVQVLKLAELMKAENIDMKLNSVLLTADYVPDAIAERLAAIWKCEVFEHYGMTEMGFGGGVFCEYRKGYHLREADLFFEIISEEGIALPEGEYGEIVFTTLTRKGMPLVRYKTGDYGRFIKERCPCGGTLKLMEKVKRRVDGGVSIRGSEFHISDFDEMLFSCDKIIDYNLELRDGKFNIEIMTINDVKGNKEQHSRLLKRQIINKGDEK